MVVKSKWASYNGKKAQKSKKAPKELSAIQLELGVKSGLEEVIAEQLTNLNVPYEYETLKIKYVQPQSNHTYTPDFILGNGIVVETKGRWQSPDRKKISLVKKQHPDLDLRIVFSNSKSKINKGSKTTYAMYCEKLGIPYADKKIPQEWIDE